MLDSLEMHNRPPLSPRRWLGPLLLGGVLIILLFIGQWLWLTRMPNTLEAPLVLPAERAPLLTTLLQQRAIVWSVTLSIVTMILAILLAVSPLPWWLQLWAIFGKTSGARLAHAVLNSQAQQSAEEWVAEQAALLETAQAQAVAAGTPDGSTAALDQTGAAASQNPPAQTGQQPGAPPAPGQQPPQPGAPPAAGQQPGAPQPSAPSAPGQQPPQPGAQQPGAPPVPGQQPPQPGAPPVPGQPPGTPPAPGQQPAPPGAPPAPGQQPGLQQLLAQEEKTDLEELTDIGDIMNSFKESDEVSAQLLALSNSLHDIDAVTLVTKSRRIADLLAASNAARHSQISKN